jgi:hypothetical protein
LPNPPRYLHHRLTRAPAAWPWTLVDAAWTPKRKAAASLDNEKSS